MGRRYSRGCRKFRSRSSYNIDHITNTITKSTDGRSSTLICSDASIASTLICSDSVESFIFTCQTVWVVWTSTCSAPSNTSYNKSNSDDQLPTSQLSAVHTLEDAPRRVSESLQVKQCAGLAGLEQVAQESSHPVWGVHIANYQTVWLFDTHKMTGYRLD